MSRKAKLRDKLAKYNWILIVSLIFIAIPFSVITSFQTNQLPSSANFANFSYVAALVSSNGILVVSLTNPDPYNIYIVNASLNSSFSSSIRIGKFVKVIAKLGGYYSESPNILLFNVTRSTGQKLLVSPKQEFTIIITNVSTPYAYSLKLSLIYLVNGTLQYSSGTLSGFQTISALKLANFSSPPISNGSNIVNVSSAPKIEFIEKGAPLGTNWSVSFNGITEYNSTGNPIYFASSPLVSKEQANIEGYNCFNESYVKPGTRTFTISYWNCTTIFYRNQSIIKSWEVSYAGVSKSSNSTNISFSIITNSIASYKATANSLSYICNSSSDVTEGKSYLFDLWDCAIIEFTEQGAPANTTWNITYDGISEYNYSGKPIYFIASKSTAKEKASINGYNCYNQSSVNPESKVINISTWICTTSFYEFGFKGPFWSVSYSNVTMTSAIDSPIFITTQTNKITSLPSFAYGPGCVSFGSATEGKSFTFYNLQCESSPKNSNITTTFFESGLPKDSNWSVSYGGVTKSAIAGNSINITISNGSISNYSAIAKVKGYECYSSLYVKAGLSYTFSSWNCITVFNESGLPSNTNWSVSYDGLSKSTTSNSI
ncbi:MAG: hypothetical protein QXX36_00800, partial [Candidatus Rehaiarchaeum fermentans]|nr:hypothetical protein [Candidatus Rehaiarchaeum fermentans]